MEKFVKITTTAVPLPIEDIDTDQIIPARFLKATTREGFGDNLFRDWRYDNQNNPKPDFVLNNPDYAGKVLVAGKNFGCGSSREHAPLALAEAGVQCVIAEFYARIFFRNSVNGGYVVPLESVDRLIEKIRTGDELEVHLNEQYLLNKTQNTRHALRPLGDVLPIIEAGGIFAYAKQTGMLK